MGENTKIEWCDHTFNPWIGCTKPQLTHCPDCCQRLDEPARPVARLETRTGILDVWCATCDGCHIVAARTEPEPQETASCPTP